MKNHKYLLVLLLLLISPCVFSLENVSVDLHLLITGAKAARAPFEFEQKVIFSYKDPRVTRFVGVAFDFEQYKTIRPFFRNENGVYMYALPYDEIPGDVTSISYRLIADGLWIADPSNPEVYRDASGIYLSRTGLRNKKLAETYPLVNSKENTVTFHYSAPSGAYVFLAGTFNNWDPFMFPLEETEPGAYSLSMRLTRGMHYYYFVYNGEKRRDVKNPAMARDPEGFTVSVVVIP